MANQSKPPSGPKKVGRGHPPEHSRFPKGTSGNPRGRPRKERDLGKLIDEELDQAIALTDQGKRVKLTKREIIAKALVNEAAKGNLRALREINRLTAKGQEREDPWLDVDPAVIAEWLARFAGGKKPE